MTSNEFVIWFSGYVDAIQTTPTQAQWDALKKKVQTVSDPISFPFGTPNAAPIVTLPHITPAPSPNPYKPYEVTCTPGTTNTPSMVVTTTPGSGSITIANPYLVSFTTGSATYPYNPSTTTMWNPTGSLWSYTDTLNTYGNWYWASTKPNQPTTGSNQLELDFEPK